MSDNINLNLLLGESKYVNQENYWKGKLAEGFNKTSLTYGSNIHLDKKTDDRKIECEISGELFFKLLKLCKNSDMSIYLILMAVLKCLVHVYTDKEDIIIGSPVYKPHVSDSTLNDIVAIRDRLTDEMTFKEILIKVRESVIEAYDNQDFPFEKLMENIVSINSDKTSLISILCMLTSIHDEKLLLNSIYDLVLKFEKSEDSIKLTALYNDSLYRHFTIEQFTTHFLCFLEAVLGNIETKISEMMLISNTMQNQLVSDFNNTKTDFPKDKPIHEVFEEQVVRNPEKICAVYNGSKITYRQLSEKAKKIGAVLRKNNVEKESIVGIVVDRSIDMLVGILGILYSGGAYLPIDPNYPIDRIGYMIKECNCSVALSQQKYMDKLKPFGVKLIGLDDEDTYKESFEEFKNINSSSDLAYVMYTSGSTGRPKGIMIEHKNVVRLVKNTNYIKFKEDDRILQTGATVFDASTFEVFGVILNGLRLYLVDEDIILDADRLKEAIEEYKITILWLTSPLFNQLVQQNAHIFKGLRNLLVGGDVLNPKYINMVKEICSEIRIINGYGPTENTTFSTCFTISDKYLENIPIGKPISNSTAYIFDKAGNIRPVGVAGELCVGGDGVGRGYINNPLLTKEKFVADPYIDGGKMYKTGDLARWLPDGNIEFLGRADYQVKIRGFRVELGEIEVALKNSPLIKDAVVVEREDKDENKFLCAYLTGDEEIPISQIRNYLSSELPHYMIPSYFIQIDEIPLTVNGKVDKNKLPETSGFIATDALYEEPENEVQQILVEIWKEILEIDRVGINDNFFELGGHSLRATILVLRIQKQFDVDVHLSEIFENPTIKEICKFIETSGRSIYSQIHAVKNKEGYPAGFYPLSCAQERLFVINRFDRNGLGYNIPIVLSVEGNLDIEKFENVIKVMIKRHEALRTTFDLYNGEPVQKVHEDFDFKIDYYKAEGEAEAEDILNNFVKPFDLDKLPLIRLGVIKLNEEKHIMIFDMHHIITDGTSMGIMINEIASLYNGDELPPIKLQYKDFSEWQNNLFEIGTIKEQENYWLDVFKGDIPVLNMPYDYIRPTVQSFEGSQLVFEIDANLTSGLKKLAKKTGATLYMTLLSLYYVLLHKYTGQEDIVVGSPIAGRSHPDIENVVGMFVNTLAMRNYPESSKTFIDFMEEVKDNSVKAFENQDYQFEELVNKLDLERDVSRNPLFDVAFVLQNMEGGKVDIEDLSFEPYEFDKSVSQFDMTFRAVEASDSIIIEVDYCTRLFKEGTIKRFVKHFTNILEQVIKNPKISISEIELITEEEKGRTLESFNNSKVGYPKDRLIHQIFEEQVLEAPDSTAVIFNEETMTYLELNKKANQLARVLRQKGINKESIVGIMVKRSFEMIIGILAILKAGGAYLPIDPEYPNDRIEYILEDSKCDIILKTSDIILTHKEIIDLDSPECYKGEDSNLDTKNVPSDLAYIIYTSGTTGNPKGVMIEHRNVVRLLINDEIQFEFHQDDVWTMFHSFCFDFSVWEMYGALLYGGKLVIVPRLCAINPKEFLDLVIKHKVTVLNQTPTAFYGFLKGGVDIPEQSLSLRYVIFGGEALNPLMLKEFRDEYPNIKLINMYGITETTVHVTYKEITTEEIQLGLSNIGKTIPTLTAYVMDSKMNLLPTGIPGELCVGGDGVARGYINNEELTNKKFVVNPYNEEERLYRSGDLVKMLDNGDMEYLGRVDRQVKIRGFRIELSEIEHQLLNHDTVLEAVVIDQQDINGNKSLLAYVVWEKELTTTELIEHLKKRLPEYMIPTSFYNVDKIPLTPNGKKDIKRLQRSGKNIGTSTEYEKPENEIQQKLVSIWQDILEIEKVGINDNFFELGGNSILLIRMHSMLENELNVKVLVASLFMFPTIKTLSEHVIKSAIQKRKNIKIKSFMIDADYFNVGSGDFGVAVYDFGIDQEFLKKLKGISAKMEIELVDILLSIFYYSMADLTLDNEVVVQTMINNYNRVVDVSINFDNIESFADLMGTVKNNRCEANKNEGYHIQELNEIGIVKEKMHIVPFFYKRELLTHKTDIFDYYDISISFIEQSDGIKFICEFNKQRIKGQKVKELFQKYSMLLEGLIKKE